MAFAHLTYLQYLSPLYPPTLSVRQVSEITSETEQTIRNALNKKRYPIPSFKIGSKRVFSLVEVAAYLEALRTADPSHLANQRPKRGRPTKVEKLLRERAHSGLSAAGSSVHMQGDAR